ncbi:MAG: hypothetical protein PHG25_03610 [Candidatus Pacebacteria bacterium]|nr:hypothetical protein [Candidatus Paceibacterota bacterium]
MAHLSFHTLVIIYWSGIALIALLIPAIITIWFWPEPQKEGRGDAAKRRLKELKDKMEATQLEEEQKRIIAEQAVEQKKQQEEAALEQQKIKEKQEQAEQEQATEQRKLQEQQLAKEKETLLQQQNEAAELSLNRNKKIQEFSALFGFHPEYIRHRAFKDSMLMKFTVISSELNVIAVKASPTRETDYDRLDKKYNRMLELIYYFAPGLRIPHWIKFKELIIKKDPRLIGKHKKSRKKNAKKN